MIRPKLIMAFVAMTMLTLICGAVGMIFVQKIGDAVTVFANVTSPMQSAGMGMVSNADRMRSVLSRVEDRAISNEEATRLLTTLAGEGRSYLAQMQAFAKAANIDVDVPRLSQEQESLVRTLETLLMTQQREQQFRELLKDRLDALHESDRDLQTSLAALSNLADGRLIIIEEKAKVQVQTGQATVSGLGVAIDDALTDKFPVVQLIGRLVNALNDVRDLTQLFVAQDKAAGLQSVESEVSKSLKTADALVQKLRGRLRDPEGKATLDTVRTALDSLKTAFAPEGVFAAQYGLVDTLERRALGNAALSGIETRYFALLEQVNTGVREVNQSASARAARDIGAAWQTIGGAVLLALAAGLAFGVIFAGRITAPIRRLSEHAAAISSTGELVPLLETRVTARHDEIGMLARSWNAMIAELAAARSRLIERSEAAIAVQFERLNVAINNMPQGLCMFDAEHRLIICNSQYAAIYDLSPELTKPGTSLSAILGHHVAMGRCPEDTGEFVEERLAAVAKHKSFYFINEMRDGRVIAISHQPMANGGSLATHEDITERRRAEAKIAYLAHHDALTGLPNRASFRDEMDIALSRVEDDKPLAVLCLDLDQFKAVNDTLGHPVGDVLLQAAAARIRGCTRATDVVARLGGDEFAIVQFGVEQPGSAINLADRLVKAFSEPFDVLGHQVVVGTSVGIAIAPNDGRDSEKLLKNADMALYRAKGDGRATYRFFEPEMDSRMQERRTLELDLRKAVAVGEFELYYQPILTLQSEQITGFEALLRWHHPRRGLISPNDFIPLAEEIGLINPIGAWVLKQACAQAVTWPKHVDIAVNLSPVQFKSGTLVLDVAAALGKSGLSPSRLELEITEAVLLHDTESTVNTLNQLRSLGVRIAMDDFGTGYSSLGYLRKFPFDKIKIDQSFIRDISDKPDSMAIIRAVTGLGASLGISTTAEGVETREQLRRLKEEGCTDVQGYLFAKPMPADRLKDFMRSRKPQAVA